MRKNTSVFVGMKELILTLSALAVASLWQMPQKTIWLHEERLKMVISHYMASSIPPRHMVTGQVSAFTWELVLCQENPRTKHFMQNLEICDSRTGFYPQVIRCL